MSDDFYARLPRTIRHCSGSDFVYMEKASYNGHYTIDTGDPCCDVRMSWDSWVAFAREIIAADDAARAGGGV